MPNYNLPKALFDTDEMDKALDLMREGHEYDSSLLVLALKDYMKKVDPTLDTYDPSRQLIAAFTMSNAEFLADSWNSWISVMKIHHS